MGDAEDGSALLGELGSVLPVGSLVTDSDILEGYRNDAARWVEGGRPLALVSPTRTPEVQSVLRIASARGVPVVPRGAGSGLSGGAAAIEGCVVLSTMKMDRILEVDAGARSAVVQPGVINAEVSQATAEDGLWYPPDPASKAFSTIGGNIATNAGGLCCVKYGVTRDYVLGLEVVLADGTLLRTGRRTVKGVAGLDLTGLIVGSEGTLGVVTEARLRLRAAPPAARTAVAFFPTLTSAGQAVAAVLRSGVVPSLVELLDRTTIRAVDDWKRMGLDRDAGALLLLQSDAPAGSAGPELDVMTAGCESSGASYVARSESPDESEELMTARRLAYPALERLGTTLLDDVAVPTARVPDLLAAIETVAERREVLIGTFGHAGDGNMHPTIVVAPDDEAARSRATAAFEDIVKVAIELGGTITGEHGVGVLKNPYVEDELGPAVVGTHRAIKTALDPRGILNPGKALGY